MIRTGRTSHSPTSPAARHVRRGNAIVVRMPGDTATYSATVRVADGEVFRLTAYDLCEGSICVDRVVLGTAVMPTIPCCESRGSLMPDYSIPPVLYRKPALGCDGEPLRLDANQTELDLEGPGTFQLIFDCAIDAYVEGVRSKACCETSR